MIKKGFHNNVEEFIEDISLDKEASDKFRREIVRLILQVQDGAGASHLSRMSQSLNVRDNFSNFKNQYLDVSAYLHKKLWKSVTKYVQTGEMSSDPQEKEDIEYCLQYINDKDIERLKAKEIKASLCLDHIDLATFTTGVKKKKTLPEYVKSKSHALRFIADNDPGVDLEDLEQDLLCEFLRVWNIYQRSKGTNIALAEGDDIVTKASKYIETALNNKVMNLKEYYTCDSRRRVVAADDSKYKLRDKMKKKMREYVKTKSNGPNRKQFGKMSPLEKELSVTDQTYKGMLAELNTLDKELRTSFSDFIPMVTSLVKADAGGESKNIEVIDGSQDMDFSHEEISEDSNIKRHELLDSVRSCLERYSTSLSIKDVGTKVILNLSGTKVQGEVIDGDFDYAIIECRVGAATHYIDTREQANAVDTETIDKLKKFVSLVMGEPDSQFELWATGQKLDCDNVDHLIRGARKYIGLNKDEFDMGKEAFKGLKL